MAGGERNDLVASQLELGGLVEHDRPEAATAVPPVGHEYDAHQAAISRFATGDETGATRAVRRTVRARAPAKSIRVSNDGPNAAPTRQATAYASPNNAQGSFTPRPQPAQQEQDRSNTRSR